MLFFGIQMNCEQKTLLAMGEVERIRGDRRRKELIQLLPELRNVGDEIATVQRRIDALESSKRKWMQERHIGSSRIVRYSDQMIARIEWIDQEISHNVETLRILEDRAEVLNEQCGSERRRILKHDELEKIFRRRGRMIGRLRRRADEENEDVGVTAGRRRNRGQS
ncbi:hypothetical protein [Burkholderia ubonensis]|uniref:hypothetical protein n=1 Tax=Burkholderia ubonensis TaxID=101571 RepID=UPI0012F7EC48|nr:hypothetical protein [Burkholderia ubonensis]